MIDTFLSAWPTDVDLAVFTEDCTIIQHAPNLTVYDLATVSPEIVAFKNKYKNDPRANGQGPDPSRKDAKKTFKWDAIRFCHKVYSICAAAKLCNTGCLIWMDADMVCHEPITKEKIAQLIPADKDLCFLGRRQKFTECGLYSMNLNSLEVNKFLAKFQDYYDNPEQGIFTLDEWHDSFVFDAVRKQFNLRELDWTGHILTGEGHPLVNCEWGKYLDHLKGDRKKTGKSWGRDFKVPRTESYWQNLQR
jgi:hypothetical protein